MLIIIYYIYCIAKYQKSMANALKCNRLEIYGNLSDCKYSLPDTLLSPCFVENNTLEGSPQKKKVAIIVSVVLSALLLLGLGLFLFLQKKKKKHNRHHMLGRTSKLACNKNIL
ncbi:hypothetical protein OIU76_025590 [Salix suchowensis]|nr:hypothetical protein OIU78_025201 [Salix suchowensis]KAJ6376469.1 hypothetical protein OIU76_025590 [Salix suchowensis]